MFAEDLTVFFDTVNGFAKPATLQGGAADGVLVIFDEAFLDQLGIAGTTPAAAVMADSVAEADIGKTLTIGSTVYTIKERDLIDDGAIAVLRLKR